MISVHNFKPGMVVKQDYTFNGDKVTTVYKILTVDYREGIEFNILCSSYSPLKLGYQCLPVHDFYSREFKVLNDEEVVELYLSL